MVEGFNAFQSKYNEDVESNATVEVITCKDCGVSFILTRGEADFFDKLNFPHPQRCKACRLRKKKSREKKPTKKSQ